MSSNALLTAVLPLHGTDSVFCAEAAAKLDAIVLDCDYRKAPEYPFPAPCEDAQDVRANLLRSLTSRRCYTCMQIPSATTSTM